MCPDRQIAVGSRGGVVSGSCSMCSMLGWSLVGDTCLPASVPCHKCQACWLATARAAGRFLPACCVSSCNCSTNVFLLIAGLLASVVAVLRCYGLSYRVINWKQTAVRAARMTSKDSEAARVWPSDPSGWDLEVETRRDIKTNASLHK